MAERGPGHKQAREAHRRRRAHLENLAGGMTIEESLAELGVGREARKSWRKRWRDFAAEEDVILGRGVEAENPESSAPRHTRRATSGFAAFRSEYLGHDSPWFHQLAITAMEEAEPGSVTLILWPPFHGKTALWEDAATFMLCEDPSLRFIVGSQKQEHAKKILSTVRKRFEPDAEGLGLMRARFGPFRHSTGQNARTQPWGSTYFDVAKKPKGIGGERNYSMEAIGMGGSIIGSRCDWLWVDDPQSRKTAGQTDRLVDEFRQDWLSRPNVEGRTVILMNRVAEHDFATALLADEDGLVDHLIKVPAWDAERGWAWPERFTEDDYLRMKRNAGPDGWARNYMQLGANPKSMTFTDEIIAKGANPLRSFEHGCPADPRGGPAQCVVSVDPGYGRNAVVACAHEPTRIRFVARRIDVDFTRPEEIFLAVEDVITTVVAGGGEVTDLVIESKAFQSGLLTDDRMRELQRTYGFEVHGHNTGDDKTDEDIGVPQIAMSLRREEIDFPDATVHDREEMEGLYSEMRRWRPGVRGTKLQQDELMAFWFNWSLWRRRRRRDGGQRTSRWQTTGITRGRGTSWASRGNRHSTSSGRGVRSRRH